MEGDWSGLRLGLCCTFVEAPIRFRTTTAAYVARLAEAARAPFLRGLIAANAAALDEAIAWCAAHGVGAFRVNSGILPLYTHPDFGYELGALDEDGALGAAFQRAGASAGRAGVRLSFHPDQFVVPGSMREEVVERSLAELEYLAFVAERIGAEQITLHGGGAQGGKEAALSRLARGLERLGPAARSRVALENDDRVYTVEDLLPVCAALGLPLLYDVHHHRCLPDRLDEAEATEAAAATWGAREPWVHVSSPRDGWGSGNPRLHADFVDVADLPASWKGRRMTVDVEAKAKERAVLALAAQLGR